MRFLLVLLTLLACACGPAHACQGCTAPTVPVVTTAAPGFDVLITDTDRAVTVRLGQRIELVLHARPGMSSWSGVNVDDSTILKAVPTGITAARGVTIAGYAAVRPGTATIRATATPLCSPGQACPLFAMLFEAQVTVT
ncbi:MAG TPA: hypothetical protein VGV88_02095 [Candidatus Dormibacteraeota bacterium]|nr:hypothetical protein [Candidatus Dormibacteraeota bacterium]